MNFVKQYLVQSITNAAENLRLNSNQIETLALFKELILKSDHLEDDLISMKKITELSTLAIKLHEIYSSIEKYPVDISVISDRFKNHCQQLSKDVNHLLYIAEHSDLKGMFEKIKQRNVPPAEKITKSEIKETKPDKGSSSFKLFEETILKPIKPLDEFLTEINENSEFSVKIDEFIRTMEINSGLSKNNGFDILSGMHLIVHDSLTLIKEGNLKPDKETISALKACLIVIAALIRGKEVNISDYINKAESFSNKINSIKQGLK